MGIPVRNHHNSISMKDIISQLAEHDWYYFMSDDPSAFSRGQASEHKLRNELMKYELSHIINRLEILKERVTELYNQK